MMAMTYGNVYVARVAMGANDVQTRQGVPRSRSLRRAVAHHRLQPLHRPRLRPGARPGPAEGGGRVRPLAALPLQPGAGRARARTRSSSIRKRADASRSRTTSTTKPATPCWPRAIRRRPRRLLDLAQSGRASSAGSSTSTWPACRPTAAATRRREASDRPYQDHRPFHHVPGAEAEEPAGGLLLAALRGRGQHPPDGRCRRRGRGAALAVRGADRARERGAGPTPSRPPKIAAPKPSRMFPGHAALQPRAGRLPGAHRARPRRR